MEVSYADLAMKAREYVSSLDEPYRSSAYQVILTDLIVGSKVQSPILQVRPDFESRSEDDHPKPVERFLTSVVDAAPYLGLFSAAGHLVEKSMAVLRIARDQLGLDGLTPAEIAEILTSKFRVARVRRSNVSYDLGKATQFLHRVKVNGGYKYLLMGLGEQHLEATASQFK